MAGGKKKGKSGKSMKGAGAKKAAPAKASKKAATKKAQAKALASGIRADFARLSGQSGRGVTRPSAAKKKRA